MIDDPVKELMAITVSRIEVIEKKIDLIMQTSVNEHDRLSHTIGRVYEIEQACRGLRQSIDDMKRC